MSTHYSNRQPSVCLGCLAALAAFAGSATIVGYACGRVAAWLAEQRAK